MNKPRILFWDIETSLMKVAVFQLKNDYINPQNILQDWHIISASWMFEGDKKVSHASSKKGDNDKALVKQLADLIGQADIIVHHNGDSFDVKKLHARMAYHGLKPTHGKLRTVDTKKEAKKHFNFSSNTLYYLAKFLGVPQKRESDHSYWMKELNKDYSMMPKMLKYGDGDVISLRGVYKKLLPFIDHPNTGRLKTTDCPNCGSQDSQNRGITTLRSGIDKQRMSCNSCGKWFDVKVGL